MQMFYQQLNKVTKTALKKSILIAKDIHCHWNSKVSPDAYQQSAGTEGIFGLGKTNDRGLGLNLANSLHSHKKINEKKKH